MDGAAVTADWMPGVEHSGSSIDAAPTYIDWLAGLLAGEEVPSTCGEEPPIPPAREME